MDKSGEIFVVPSGQIILHGSILHGCQFQLWESQASTSHVGDFTVLREHCSDDICNDLKSRLVRRGHINEDVFCVQGDFAVFRINNRWHRQNAILCIVDDWIDRRVSDDM